MTAQVELTKTCLRPGCQEFAAGRAQVDALFGFRKMNGRRVPQSWCRACRGGSTMSLVDDRPAAGDRWATPSDVFQAWNARADFTVDAAAEAGNALVARFFPNGLRASWEGERVWCNPPYSAIDPWIHKADESALAVFLVPARTDRPWFSVCWDRAARQPAPGWLVDFPQGRVRFKGADQDPNWASVVCAWDPAGVLA